MCGFIAIQDGRQGLLEALKAERPSSSPISVVLSINYHCCEKRCEIRAKEKGEGLKLHSLSAYAAGGSIKVIWVQT